MLPGWYGFGTAVETWLAANPRGLAHLADMHARWPFFRSVLSNMSMVLAKTDLAIASRYAELVDDPSVRDAVFPRIVAEHGRSIRHYLRITQQSTLLEDNPTLARSIRNRFPYLDPLNHLQVELLRRHPDNAEIAAAALTVVLDPGVLPELARFAESEDADVRQSLAVAYGRLGGLADAETVTRLMCDKVWWVRYRAGQALLTLKGMTEDRLAAVREHLADPYARDMLDHVRAEAALS